MFIKRECKNINSRFSSRKKETLYEEELTENFPNDSYAFNIKIGIQMNAEK